jgi:hypothetical protein
VKKIQSKRATLRALRGYFKDNAEILGLIPDPYEDGDLFITDLPVKVHEAVRAALEKEPGGACGTTASEVRIMLKQIKANISE